MKIVRILSYHKLFFLLYIMPPSLFAYPNACTTAALFLFSPLTMLVYCGKSLSFLVVVYVCFVVGPKIRGVWGDFSPHSLLHFVSCGFMFVCCYSGGLLCLVMVVKRWLRSPQSDRFGPLRYGKNKNFFTWELRASGHY